MLKGDISNRQAPIIAFNVDNLLFKQYIKPKNIIVRLIDKFVPKDEYIDRDIDTNFEELLLSLWTKRPYSIYLISFKAEIEEELTELLVSRGVCYTKLVCVESLDDLIHSCRYHYTYYFDSDESLLSMIGTHNVYPITEVNSLLR